MTSASTPPPHRKPTPMLTILLITATLTLTYATLKSISYELRKNHARSPR